MDGFSKEITEMKETIVLLQQELQSQVLMMKSQSDTIVSLRQELQSQSVLMSCPIICYSALHYSKLEKIIVISITSLLLIILFCHILWTTMKGHGRFWNGRVNIFT